MRSNALKHPLATTAALSLGAFAALSMVGAEVSSGPSGAQTRRVVIKDCEVEPTGLRGHVSSPGIVLKKVLRLKTDPAAVRAATLLYRMCVQPYYPPTRKHYGGMAQGVEWPDLVVLVNEQEACRAPFGEAATQGWHEVSIPTGLLREGDNVVLFKHAGRRPGYFYLGGHRATQGHSFMSDDGGRTFRPHPDEFIVSLRLDVAAGPDRPAFATRGGHAYGWLEVEDLFDRKRRSPDGWLNIAYPGVSQPSRGLVAHSMGDRTLTVPFDLPRAGRWHVWVRGWQDGFRAGRFRLEWNGTEVFDSQGHSWTGDVDVRYDWLKCGATQLAAGRNTLRAVNTGECGHMFDVIVLTTDADYAPDDKQPLPQMPVAKQVLPEGIGHPEPGPYMTQDPVVWAKPTAGGPLRTLWVCADINELEIVELSRRLDLSYDVLSSQVGYYSGRGRFGQDLGADQTDLLYQVLQDKEYDVLILVRVNLDQIPEDLQTLIAAKVKAGLGLVRVGSDREQTEGHVVGRLFKDLSALEMPHLRTCFAPKAFPWSRSGKVGAGRVVDVGYMIWGMMGYRRDEEAAAPYYPVGELWFARWAKWLLLAAGRFDGGPGIESLAVEAGRPLKLTVTCHDTPAGARVRVVCFAPWEGHRAEVTADVTAGRAATTVPVGRENGLYRLQVALTDQAGRVLDFAAEDLVLRDPPGISEVVLPDDRVDPARPIPVTIRMRGPAPAPGRVTLLAELVAAHGRLLASTQEVVGLSADEAEASLSLSMLPSQQQDWFARVHVRLSDASGTVLERRRGTVFIRQPPVFDDYRGGSGIWQQKCLPDYVRHVPARVLQDLGMDAVLTADIALGSPVPPGLRYFHIFRLTSAGNPTWTEKRERVPCIHDPKSRAGILRELEDGVRSGRRLSALTLGLGDETHGGVCWSTHTLDAFRRYLEGRYGDVARLNQAWSTNFPDFGSAMPRDAQTALKRPENIAPYIEYALFNARQWAGFAGEFVARSREIAPDVTTGGLNPFGPTSENLNFFSLLFPPLDYASVYPRQFDRARCFIRNMRTTSVWTGYDRSREQMENEVWRAVTYGATLVGWYGTNRYEYGTLSTTYGMTERARWIKAINEGLTDGTAKLLIQGDVEPAPVAIVLSGASLLAYPVKAKAAEPTLRLAGLNSIYELYRTAYVQMVDPAHVQYDYVTEEQVAEGLPQHYRVLIFPCAAALSDACIGGARAFTDRGIVIADEEFGHYDEIGRRRQQRDVLGGEHVVLFKGGPVRLGESNTERFRAALAAAEVRSGEAYTPNVTRVIRKTLGSGRLIVAFGRGDVEIRFADEAHTYDVREHCYLGHTDRVALSRELGPFALMRLPYKANELTLESPRLVRVGEAVEFAVRLSADRGDPGVHVVRARVFGPDGRPRRLYSRNLLCRSGRATASFQLAWNDPAGVWRIAARDVVSGLEAERELTVAARR